MALMNIHKLMTAQWLPPKLVMMLIKMRVKYSKYS